MNATNAVPTPDATAEDLALLLGDLQLALQVEHATVPPYLAAWVSLENDSASNEPARRILRSVFTEEMLHMTQVANLLLAVGGTPRLAYPGFVPSYPHSLPGAAADFTVDIGPFSEEAVKMFMRIEQPMARDAPGEERLWHTIGQLYEGIADRYHRVLAEQPGLLAANLHRQIPPEAFYGSGRLVTIATPDDVDSAIREITVQGEGDGRGVFDDDASIFGDGREPAHFYRFDQILRGKLYERDNTVRSGPTGERIDVVYAAANPMRVNAAMSDYDPDSTVYRRLVEFNVLYGRLLTALESAYTGSATAFQVATAQMFAVGRSAAAISRMPDPRGGTAGLVFEPIFAG
jgi:hypothetical protein